MTTAVAGHAFSALRAVAWTIGILMLLVVATGLFVAGAYLINCEWVIQPLIKLLVWIYRVGGF